MNLRTRFKQMHELRPMLTYAAMGKALGVSPTYLYRLRGELGLSRRKRGPKIEELVYPIAICDDCRPQYEKLYSPQDRRPSDRCIHWRG